MSVSISAASTIEDLLAESIETAQSRAASAFDEAAAPFEDRLVLFGAGALGRRTLAGLRATGTPPLAFADNNPAVWGTSIDGIPVYSPQAAAERFGTNAAFVIAIWNGQATDCMASRVSQLRKLGSERAIPAGLLFWKYPDVFLPYYMMDLPDKLLGHAEEIRAVFEMWEDEASREEYLAQLTFRLRMDFSALHTAATGHEYFPGDLFRLSKTEVLADCGAFDGDTIQTFIEESRGEFASVLAFEPDPLNWPKLQQRVAGFAAPLRRKIACFPYAIGGRAGTVMFNATGTQLSTMGAGGATVECVRLDDVLRTENPTLIKFDIEGAELEALAGAREIVRRCRPILAVSAYHQQSHLWDIPLALREMAESYRYYLRPYAAEGFDLMCYAIPEERCTA